MEDRETFIVTLFCDPERSIEPRGRLRHVSTNREAMFRNLGELTGLLVALAQRGVDTGQPNDEQMEGEEK